MENDDDWETDWDDYKQWEDEIDEEIDDDDEY
jgi:hypothetical protein